MDIIILVIIIIGAMVLFISEWLPIDLVAGLIVASLLLTNILSLDQALAGVSNPATVTIGAMFVLSYALSKTGVINYLGNWIIHYTRGRISWLFAIFLTTVAVISSFINNTAAVAIFLPLGLQFANEFQFSPSKILIPLSYAAIVGGTMTLIGTSTNIIVATIAVEHNLPRIGMFEFTKLGIILLVVGLVYLILFARKYLPERTSTFSLTQKYHLSQYLTEVQVTEDSPLVNKTPMDRRLGSTYEINILGIIRGDRKILADIRITTLQPGDILLVRGQFDRILRMKEREKLLFITDRNVDDEDLALGDTTLTEVIVAPHNKYIGQTLKEMNFRKRYGCFVLAIRKHGETLRDKIINLPVNATDTLLVYGSKRRIDTLREDQNFIVLQEIDLKLLPGRKWIIALGVILGVVLLAALNILPIMVAALLGCLTLVLTRVITLQEVYQSIDWSIIFLLAGVIPLGNAMEITGLATMIGDGVAHLSGALGPVAVLGGIYLVTSLLTEIMSNNSTAILMAPIAIAIADALALSPYPFLMAIAFAASASFLTPVGYQTNAMVYGPGGYKYRDYTAIGSPLQLIFWIIATALIPIIWPF